MAYNKKTWLARLGQGLNKFSIDGATPVPIISQPDSVTQQGDALSAGNLNDLEQRIADAFDDVEESKADKSTTEALQSQINQHESRLENLEQKAGDYTTVQYRGTNAVPTGKAKNGLVEKIVGKSRAWNQLVRALTSSIVNNETGTSSSTSDGVITFTNTVANNGIYIDTGASIINGHKYLFGITVKASSSVEFVFGSRSNSVGLSTQKSITTSYARYFSDIKTATDSYSDGYVSCYAKTANTTVYVKEWTLFDLTLIFGAGNEPSTVADALAQLPALGQYNAYDAGSLVDTEVSGVKSVGVNIWDEEWELGYIDWSGVNAPSSVRIRSKNYIPVLPSMSYYYKASKSLQIFYYDINKNFISYETSSLFNASRTTPSNCYYVRFYVYDTSYGVTYLHDIQICLDSYADKTTYHPYKTDTLSLSETVTLRSDDELMLETGTIVRKMVRVDLSDYDWSYSNGYWYMASGTKKDSFTNIVKGFGGSHVPNWVSAKYEIVKGSEVVLGVKLYAIGQSSDNSIICHNGSNTTPPSGALVAELATPTIESIDPIIDNFLEVQGGGTVETIQTQTPVIDNCLDVGYLTV